MEKKITILGDILFSRVARSNLWGLIKLGANVTFAGPSTLVPREFEELGATVTHNINDALMEADAVMLLRIQHERFEQQLDLDLETYKQDYQLTSEKMDNAKGDAIIMHPGPVNYIEITEPIYDSEQSVIRQQVKNGVAIRMAVLSRFLSC